MDIEIRGIHKRFGTFVALDGIDLTIAPGELVALLGPSGSGKTTLLRIIGGLEQPTSGSVLFGGDDLVGRSLRERKVGFVFQHYALFRHMTVFENVAFGLRVKRRRDRPREVEIKERVMLLLDLVHLAPFAQRYPSQLSGGQRQRVALARALAIEPRFLLLDEPFGALDARVRKELRRWLRRLHDDMGLTSIFVTHDQEEALELADRVVVMNEGRIEQIGDPDAVYTQPATPFVYAFLGRVNRVACRIVDGQWIVWECPIPLEDSEASATDHAVAYVRPHDVEIFADAILAGREAVVTDVAVAGALIHVDLRIEGDDTPIEAEVSRAQQQQLKLTPGRRVFIRPRQARVFRADASGTALNDSQFGHGS